MAYRFANPYTLALLLASAVMVSLALATLRHRRERVGRAFFGFLLGIGLWALADAMRYAADTRAAILLWNRIGYLGIVAIPPTLLLFVMAYTGRDRWFRRRYLLGLFAVSAVAYALVVTNPIHGLWFDVAGISPGTAPPVLREDWGPAWYAWAIYAYGIVLTVTYLMAREFLIASRSGTHRGQTGMILAGILLAAVVNGLFIFDIVAFDPVPFVFAVTGLCFGVAMFRYRLLTLLPIARDTVVETMDSGVIVLDRDDTIVDVNDRARTMFDLHGSDPIGTPIVAALDTVPAVGERLAADQVGKPIALETADGIRHFEVDVSPLTDALDTHVGRVVVFTDITRRMRQQQQLEERTAELERTNERLEEFASVVSHDLRNPLNVVFGRVDLARGSEDPDPHLDSIEQAARRMESMIDDLLTLARQGRTVGELEPVRLDQVVAEAWTPVGTEGATLTCETSATIRADPDRLQEVLENLFRNSIDHGRSGESGGTVAPGTDAEPEADPDTDGVQVRVGDLENGFYVEDDGAGIPAENRDRVFETGYTTAPDGTGIGLDIVRDIVRAHGWHIDVTNGTDGGARFEITGVEIE